MSAFGGKADIMQIVFATSANGRHSVNLAHAVPQQAEFNS
jgi:hypothetical protein